MGFFVPHPHLQIFAKLVDAKKVVEVGTYTGYSSLSVALVLPEGGRLVTCDVSEEVRGCRCG